MSKIVIRSFDFVSFNDTKQVINYSLRFRRVEKNWKEIDCFT